MVGLELKLLAKMYMNTLAANFGEDEYKACSTFSSQGDMWQITRSTIIPTFSLESDRSIKAYYNSTTYHWGIVYPHNIKPLVPPKFGEGHVRLDLDIKAPAGCIALVAGLTEVSSTNVGQYAAVGFNIKDGKTFISKTTDGLGHMGLEYYYADYSTVDVLDVGTITGYDATKRNVYSLQMSISPGEDTYTLRFYLLINGRMKYVSAFVSDAYFEKFNTEGIFLIISNTNTTSYKEFYIYSISLQRG